MNSDADRPPVGTVPSVEGTQSRAVWDAVEEGLIELVAEALGRGYKKGRCKDLIRDFIAKMGVEIELNYAYLEQILRSARALLREQLGEDKVLQKAYGVDFYRQVLSDDDAPIGAKLAAQDGLNRILGLEHKFSRDDSETADAEQTAADIRDTLRRMDEATLGDESTTEATPT